MVRRIVAKPPRKPTKGRVKLPKRGLVIPYKITMQAPRDAPEETPRVYEEARGFRKTDCITTPLTDKAAPAVKARKVRGSLKVQRMDTAVGRIWGGKFPPQSL